MLQRLALSLFAVFCVAETPVHAMIDPTCGLVMLAPETRFHFDSAMRAGLLTVAEELPPLNDATLGGTIDAYLENLGFASLPNSPGVRRWRSEERRVEVQVTFLASSFGPRGSLSLRTGDAAVDYSKMANGRTLRWELDGEIATFRQRWSERIRRWRGGFPRTFDAMAIEVLHHEHVHVRQSQLLPSHQWADAELTRLGREGFIATHGARARAAILLSEFQAHGQSPRTTPGGPSIARAWRRFRAVLVSPYPTLEGLASALRQGQRLLLHYDVGGDDVIYEALEWMAHGSTMATRASQPDQVSQ